MKGKGGQGGGGGSDLRVAGGVKKKTAKKVSTGVSGVCRALGLAAPPSGYASWASSQGC